MSEVRKCQVKDCGRESDAVWDTSIETPGRQIRRVYAICPGHYQDFKAGIPFRERSGVLVIG